MNRKLRTYFDQQLEWVLTQVPLRVHELLEEVTMYVEDYPSPTVLRRTGIRRRRNLCGLYTGIPLTHKQVEASGVLSDAIYLYREGILSLAVKVSGKIDDDELRRQIRITMLHELGHYHGLSEHELEELGY
ncbi:MAG: metallopeptidase family protein [Planctomycetota bacterium]|nr:metallopeptidase family protein [Planctomycetota bacterium]